MVFSITAALLMARWVLSASARSCDQAQYLHPNGSCLPCLVCDPGEQLSEDCGYGDGGAARCEACGEGEYSEGWALAPCWQCTRCSLLNREERVPCQPSSNAQCGGCLGGYYETPKEQMCLPCLSSTGAIRRECLPPPTASPEEWKGVTPFLDKAFPEGSTGSGAGPDTPPVAVIGAACAVSAFSLVLLLWGLLLSVERISECHSRARQPAGPRAPDKERKSPGTLDTPSGPPDCSCTPASLRKLLPFGQHSQEGELERRHPSSGGPPRSRYTPCSEKAPPPASIVINVTTNVKPPGQGGGGDWEGQDGHHQQTQLSLEEMERKTEEICKIAKGRSLEELDYDSIQELSLLVDAGGRGALRGLGRALSVSPEVLDNLHGFQDLFQYLRTSTYTQVPQLACAAASLHRPDLVARIHQALVSVETTSYG
ncbi:uncharacterized protein [Lepisosteus oculatus]|uniref:uncharacterized protein n=1 Tax=Lepisosteus oculatus TaxID=7918 RepID=UPI003721AFC4